MDKELEKICLFCGNTSGMTDNRGQCISCGAPFIQNYIEGKTIGKTVFPDFNRVILESKENDSYVDRIKKDVADSSAKIKCSLVKEIYDSWPEEIKEACNKIEAGKIPIGKNLFFVGIPVYIAIQGIVDEIIAKKRCETCYHLFSADTYKHHIEYYIPGEHYPFSTIEEAILRMIQRKNELE